MPLHANKFTKADEDYTTPFTPKGYLARIVQVVDLGKQPQTDWKTHEPKDPKFEVMITFEFPDVRNDDDKPCWLSKRYQFPLAWPQKTGLKNNTNLYKMFNMFSPELLTPSEMFPEYFFIADNIWENLLNQEAYVDIALTNTGRPKITTIQKVPDFAGKVPELESSTLLFDATTASVEQWTSLYEWVRKILLHNLDDDTREAASKLEGEVKEKEQSKVELEEEDIAF